jgi:hypothetical protein
MYEGNAPRSDAIQSGTSYRRHRWTLTVPAFVPANKDTPSRSCRDGTPSPRVERRQRPVHSQSPASDTTPSVVANQIREPENRELGAWPVGSLGALRSRTRPPSGALVERGAGTGVDGDRGQQGSEANIAHQERRRRSCVPQESPPSSLRNKRRALRPPARRFGIRQGALPRPAPGYETDAKGSFQLSPCHPATLKKIHPALPPHRRAKRYQDLPPSRRRSCNTRGRPLALQKRRRRPGRPRSPGPLEASRLRGGSEGRAHQMGH